MRLAHFWSQIGASTKQESFKPFLSSLSVSSSSNAPFFTDFDDDNEDPLTLAMKIVHPGLPKFSNLDYNLQKFTVNEFPDTDLTDNLIDHIIAEFNKTKSTEAIDDQKDKLEDDIKAGN